MDNPFSERPSFSKHSPVHRSSSICPVQIADPDHECPGCMKQFAGRLKRIKAHFDEKKRLAEEAIKVYQTLRTRIVGAFGFDLEVDDVSAILRLDLDADNDDDDEAFGEDTRSVSDIDHTSSDVDDDTYSSSEDEYSTTSTYEESIADRLSEDEGSGSAMMNLSLGATNGVNTLSTSTTEAVFSPAIDHQTARIQDWHILDHDIPTLSLESPLRPISSKTDHGDEPANHRSKTHLMEGSFVLVLGYPPSQPDNSF